ncbi:MAG: hypothetical protein J7621_06790 [Niastella sp.]|nr:hypothetical protein [Niastella sp.]
MRIIICIIITFLVTVINSHGQPEKPAKSFPSAKAMKSIAGSMVNQFQQSVRKTCDCPLMILDGVLELFSENARIEVTSLNRTDKVKYKPRDYFETVNSLKCSNDPVYDSMSFDYLPVDPEDGTVSTFDGSYTITYNITQTFNGKPVKKKRRQRYCDITIKKVVINFWFDRKGILMAKIIGVLVEKTKNCNGNEKLQIETAAK